MIEIDPAKRSVYFYYLARAAKRQYDREIRRRQAEAGIRKLKKLDTKHIHSHLNKLEGHLKRVSGQEQLIKEMQEKEEKTHGRIKYRIRELDEKLGKYLATAKSRKKRIKELEEKIRKKFKLKKEKVEELKKTMNKLTEIYEEAKEEYDNEMVERLGERIRKLRAKIHLMG